MENHLVNLTVGTLTIQGTVQTTIVFIDSAVDDYQTLVNGVIPEAEVIVLDPNQDGVLAIAQALQARSNITSVHIVSHGSPGCLYLGNTQLCLDTLHHYTPQLQTWFTPSTSPSLLLYGCNVAAGDAGAEFIAKLHTLTGANIAASAKLIGNAALGGGWELEVTSGKGEFASVFAPEIMEIYPGVLNLLTNPGAETGDMSGWNILQNGGNGWTVQTGGYEGSQTFVTSYAWGKRSQTVDLVAKGYSTAVLDQAPTINISEWFRGIGPKTADLSYLKVELRDAGGNVIASFNSGELTAKSDWQQISHTFANYGAGVRYVYWEDGGKDVEYWAGHYGTQFDGASLTLTVPSNSPPTDLSLSASSIDENTAASSVVGTFSTTDPDAGNSFTYSLVSGTGSTDNTAFSIVGDQLRINASPDFETKPNHSIRVRTTDQGGLSVERELNIQVNNLNENPTDLSISNSSYNETVEQNEVIGVFSSTDPDTGNTFNYSLVAGAGDTDNAIFSIVGNELRVQDTSNLGTKTTYSVRVRTTDQGQLSTEKVFTINKNSAPTDILLSGSSVNENVPANSLVSTFTTTDSNANDTFTYSLVAGQGDTDNAAFAIQDSQLFIKNSPDFETKSSYSVRVRTTDNGGLFTEKSLNLSVNNLNDAPTNLSLSNTSINENVPASTVVGNFATIDPDASNTFTYSLATGIGSTDNSAFSIQGSQLRIKASPNFEAKSSFNIRVRSTDQGGLSFEKPLTININNLNEAPTVVNRFTNQTTGVGQNFSFQIPTNAFADPDIGDTINFSVRQANGSALPSWLTFNSSTRTLGGTPSIANIGNLQLEVKATDRSGAFASQSLNLAVTNNSFNAQDAKQGLETTLNRIQEILDAQILGNQIPIVGGLKTIAPGFINTIRDSLNKGIGTTSNFTLETFQSIVRTSLQSAFPNVTFDTTLDKNSGSLLLNIGNSYNLGSVSLAGDIGLPGLGINTTGKATGTFNYNLALGVGFHKDFGFFVDTDKTKLTSKINFGLSNDFRATGKMGFLQLDLTNDSSNRTSFGANFGVGLKDIDNIPGAANDGSRLTLSELKGKYQVSDLFNTTFQVNPKIGLKGVTSFKGSTAIPSLNFDLAADWQALKYSNGKLTGPQTPTLAFNNLQLDLGSFVTDFAKPVLTRIDNVVSPFRPAIQFMNADAGMFSRISALRDRFDRNRDGRATALEVAATLAGTNIDTRFFDAISAVDNASRLLNQISSSEGNIAIDLGSYTLSDFDASSKKSSLTNAKTTTTRSTASLNNQINSKTGNSKTGEFLNAFKSIQGLELKVLEAPTVLNLLLGKPDVTLLRYDMPDLDFNLTDRQSFPVVWPLEAVLRGDFRARTNLAFGYDTFGLERWRDSNFSASGALNVIDGFYVEDQRGNELQLNASLEAGAGVNLVAARGSLNGGLKGDVGIDIVDVGEAQGKSDGKVRVGEITSRLSRPQDLFNVNGSISAYLGARVEYWKPGPWYKPWAGTWQNAWSDEFASYELAKFSAGAPNSGRTSQKYIMGATIFLDANFNGIQDENEPFAISNSDGSYTLNIDVEKFDKNANGSIDADEGRIVSLGGMDTYTFLPMTTILTATPGSSMITPVTTLASELVHKGINPQEAQAQVKAALGLPNEIDLNTFDAIAAIKAGDPNGAKVMAAHIQVQNAIVETTKMIKGASPNLSEGEISASVIKAISNQVQPNTTLDLSDSSKLQQIIQSSVSEITAAKPGENLQKVTEIAADAAKIMADGNQKVKEIMETTSLSDVLSEVSTFQSILLSETAKDLQEAAAGTKNMEEVKAENTPEALVQEIVKQQKELLKQIVYGTEGSDNLQGNQKAVYGLAGNDTLTGFGGGNFLSGDEGDDTLIVSSNNNFGNQGDNILDGGEGNDMLVGGTGNDYLDGGIGNDTLMGGSGNETLTGGSGNDSLRGGNGSDRLQGDNGNDKLFGDAGNDILYGGAGSDRLQGDNGNDKLLGDAGNDVLYGSAGDDIVYGGAGSDRLYGDNGNDKLFGNADNDIVYGGAGSDRLYGDNGNDKLFGNADNDILYGGAGSDRLHGDNGNDILYGGAGDDILYGGPGSDRLYGDAGRDTFVLAKGMGTDTIYDFKDGVDLLRLDGGLSFGQLNIVQRGSSTQISDAITGDVFVSLYNTNSTLITQADFTPVAIL
jgi:Ca2+-binding RTX toxin-like protein